MAAASSSASVAADQTSTSTVTDAVESTATVSEG